MANKKKKWVAIYTGRLFSLLLFVFFLTGSKLATAQSTGSLDLSNVQSQDEIVSTLTPESPAPGDNVKIDIISYSFDVDRSLIVWKVNGKLAKQGTGEKTLEYRAGKLGSIDTISISAITADGKTVTKTLTIKPAEIDILWEADSYVPAWYKGKALAGSEASIKVSAFPLLTNNKGEVIPPSQLIYDWRVDYKRQPDDSGYGKSQIKIKGAQTYFPIKVSVFVSDANSSVNAQKSVDIVGERSKILVYRDSPAEGPSFYDSVKDEVAMDQGEISLVAEPFFFPFSDLPKINYAWKMNDADVQTPKKPDVLTVRNTTGGSGESQISLAASDPLNIFHQAVYDFLIKF